MQLAGRETEAGGGDGKGRDAAPVGVILAGGLGRRMGAARTATVGGTGKTTVAGTGETGIGGTDKALVALGGAPMVSHVIRRLAPQVEALAINAGGDPARFARFALPVLPDPVPDRPGPLAGILAAMLWAGDLGARQVVTVATDTPFLPDGLVARLVAGAQEAHAPIALAESGGRLHPTVGLWSVDLADDLARAIAAGQRRVAEWALGRGAVRVGFADHPTDPFFNVNTPEDLAAAGRRLAEERT